MRYAPISVELYIKNRKKLKKMLPEKALCLLFSNDLMPTNADGTFPFRQNNDLFYLCGIDQEDTVLALFPDHSEAAMREVLFIRETNETLKIWEGEKLSEYEARDLSGIQTIYFTGRFDAVLAKLMQEAAVVLLNRNEHDRAERRVAQAEDHWAEKIQTHYPLHQYGRLAPLLSDLRVLKEKEEIQQIQKAIDISTRAFLATAPEIRPGMLEYEAEALLRYNFLRQGSRGPAFGTIMASGSNACILHYTQNEHAMIAGDLVLMDFGAEYGNYNADITRTLPVTGKFTKRQKEVYQSVLRILEGATKHLIPGNTWETYQKEVIGLVETELIKLKLLTKAEIKEQDPTKPAFRKYFMHGISHFLGLDVHDVGARSIPFKAGMVLTVEPGLYIPQEGIGIRLENDILIGPKGPLCLSNEIPIEVNDIEALMKKSN